MRFDQLVGFSWKFLVPLSLVNLLLVALMVKLSANLWIQSGLILAGNLVVLAATAFILNRAARRVDEPALRRIAAVER